MRRTEYRKTPDNNAMTKKVVTVWIITVIPIIILFAVYSGNPDSPLLVYLSEVTRGLPALHSANNPLLSSVMNAWCKTAPLWGAVAFIISYKHIRINSEQTTGGMLRIVALFSAFYLPNMYMSLLYSAEITESGKLLRVMSYNDYFLVTLFITIYTVCYTFTAYYLVVLAATFKSFCQGRKASL